MSSSLSARVQQRGDIREKILDNALRALPLLQPGRDGVRLDSGNNGPGRGLDVLRLLRRPHGRAELAGLLDTTDPSRATAARALTRRLGWCWVTLGATSSMPAQGVSTDGRRVHLDGAHTRAVVDVHKVVIVLDGLDEAPDEAVSPLGGGVDRHQPKGSLAFRHVYGVKCLVERDSNDFRGARCSLRMRSRLPRSRTAG